MPVLGLNAPTPTRGPLGCLRSQALALLSARISCLDSVFLVLTELPQVFLLFPIQLCGSSGVLVHALDEFVPVFLIKLALLVALRVREVRTVVLMQDFLGFLEGFHASGVETPMELLAFASLATPSPRFVVLRSGVFLLIVLLRTEMTHTGVDGSQFGLFLPIAVFLMEVVLQLFSVSAAFTRRFLVFFVDERVVFPHKRDLVVLRGLGSGRLRREGLFKALVRKFAFALISLVRGLR